MINQSCRPFMYRLCPCYEISGQEKERISSILDQKIPESEVHNLMSQEQYRDPVHLDTPYYQNFQIEF